MPNTIHLHRVFRSSPTKIYRAFLEPDALVKWNPPNGYTGKVHYLEAQEGGTYRISFTNFATGAVHAFEGRYRELVPNQRIQCADQFDDPGLPGEVVTTIELKKISLGTELTITQEGLPDAISPEACCLGWQQSLELLAKLVEAD